MVEHGRKAIGVLGDADALALEADDARRYALERLLGIVGEAAAKMPASLRLLLPGVPWPQIVRTRHIIVHEYRGLDLARLVATVRTDLPLTIQSVEAFLAENRE